MILNYGTFLNYILLMMYILRYCKTCFNRGEPICVDQQFNKAYFYFLLCNNANYTIIAYTFLYFDITILLEIQYP